MATLSEEIAACEDMRRTLETDRLGKWAIVHGKELAEVCESFEATAEDAVGRFGRGPCLIG